jgi:hypothetical protein
MQYLAPTIGVSLTEGAITREFQEKVAANDFECRPISWQRRGRLG